MQLDWWRLKNFFLCSAALGPTFFIAKKVPFDFAKDEGKKASRNRPAYRQAGLQILSYRLIIFVLCF
jgi:hypothetical protein